MTEKAFDRLALLVAPDAIGTAAAAQDKRLDIAIYGGSALMLARNFRVSTKDVDIAEPGEWPAWLRDIVPTTASQNGWTPVSTDRLIARHLRLATNAFDGARLLLDGSNRNEVNPAFDAARTIRYIYRNILSERGGLSMTLDDASMTQMADGMTLRDDARNVSSPCSSSLIPCLEPAS